MPYAIPFDRNPCEFCRAVFVPVNDQRRIPVRSTVRQARVRDRDRALRAVPGTSPAHLHLPTGATRSDEEKAFGSYYAPTRPAEHRRPAYRGDPQSARHGDAGPDCRSLGGWSLAAGARSAMGLRTTAGRASALDLRAASAMGHETRSQEPLTQAIHPSHRRITMASPATKSDPNTTLLCRASHAGR